MNEVIGMRLLSIVDSAVAFVREVDADLSLRSQLGSLI